MLFAAKIVDTKYEVATHGSQKWSDSKWVEVASPSLSWIQSLFVETIVAVCTPETFHQSPSVFWQTN